MRLPWSTASEINNYGFEVQRSSDGKSFASIAGSFVPGNGTTNLSHAYSYVDAHPAGTTSYRLKQIDLDGTVHYSEPARITPTTAVKEQAPAVFALEQNYPNPFNPTTIIRYGLPHKSVVSLTVFNAVGQQITTLVQGEQEAGYYEARFSARSGSASGGDVVRLSSGAYFYRLQAGTYVATKKFLLLR